MKAAWQDRIADLIETRLMWLVAVPVVCIGGWWCVWLVARWVLGL